MKVETVERAQTPGGIADSSFRPLGLGALLSTFPIDLAVFAVHKLGNS